MGWFSWVRFKNLRADEDIVRKQLSKSDLNRLNEEIVDSFGVADFFNKKDNVVLIDVEGFRVVVRDGGPLFFYVDDKLVPTLKLLLESQILKQIVVDMGAVRFMTSGADVMRPGIVDIDGNIKKDEFAVIVDETHKKPLCIGRALFSGEEMAKMQTGKVLKNMHWVGDKLWNAEF